ncbi:MAG: hypothetical protein NTZ02_03460 [Candidatus Woesearchaeota archaeon]|nr:hypothetical protein [Candidatus Woesearchaeota archaeon]
MEDTYLKLGLVIVAVAVMALLIAFAFNALNSQTEEEQEIQSFSGPAQQLDYRISHLCQLCAGEADRECYLINADITAGNISNPGNAEFANFGILLPGKYSLRIESSGSKCVIRRME